MSFRSDSDVTHQFASHQGRDIEDEMAFKRLQVQKWWVLIGTFLLIAIVSLAWIWTRPPSYQSQAIVHFSFSNSSELGFDSIAIEQINLNQQRLLSNRVIEEVRVRLAEQDNIHLSAAELSRILSAEVSVSSRVVTLFATHYSPDILEPTLRNWLDFYFTFLKSETEQTASEDIALVSEKIMALEAKVTEQQEAIKTFAETNDIVSLQRDENRVLSNIKGLSLSLDKAAEDETKASSQLESFLQTTANGQTVTHPLDKARIDQLSENIRLLESELKALSQRYTAEYMAMDPDISTKESDLAEAKQQLQEMRVASQAAYREELTMSLQQAQNNRQSLSEQYAELNFNAKAFEQKLMEYMRMQNGLSELELQLQSLQNQLIDLEVSRPNEAKISVLEEPFKPSFPIGPNYKLYSAVALGVAALTSLFALLLFSFIVKQRQPVTAVTSYNIVPTNSSSLGYQSEQIRLGADNNRLADKGVPLSLGNSPSSVLLRLLSQSECQQLYDVASKQCKLAIGLLLNGVAPSNLAHITAAQFDEENQLIQIAELGSFSLPESLFTLINLSDTPDADEAQSIWLEPLNDEALSDLIINAAHDADLPFAEQITVEALRHTYLTYLVTQGARLNDLEKIAGYVNPTDLKQYRSVKRQSGLVDIDQLERTYPLNWS